MAGDDLDRMFTLVREVGRVELKFTVADASHEAVRSALGVGSERIRNVYYLDTPDLTLRHHGVLARVRGGQRPNDSVVKLRPIDPGRVPASMRRCPEFTVEVDVTPDSFICSGALKRRLGRRVVERAVAGEYGLRTLFSEQQLTLLAGRLPEKVSVDRLEALGPVEVHRTRPRHDGPGRGLELQEWTYPDGSRLLEVSTRCSAEQLLQTAAHAKSFLDRHGIAQSGPCPTKADATLEYFTRR
ncbi:MAG: adenylate cyclase [Catenulispora sp.]|nr:adenylate cyclase [Catenulispora sp.]